MFYFRFFPGAIHSGQIIEFLAALKRQIKRPLLIIWDGIATHRSRKVNAWLEGQDGQIAVARLPPYAPELNPVEAIWAFLARPCAAERYSLIYAHAQKNVGPAGVTIVLLRDDLLADVPANLPGYMDYRNHAEAHSKFNTPPVFAIYTVLLVTRWLLREVGDLSRMAAINRC